MTDRDDGVLHDDGLRFVDVLLEEALAPAGAAVVPPVTPRARGGRLAAAALLLLGLAVLFATALLVRDEAVPLQDPQPLPAPVPVDPDIVREALGSVRGIEPLAEVVLGDDDPARGLSHWGGPAPRPQQPRILDPRDPWARPDPGSVAVRPERGAPVEEPRVTEPGTPALGLLRDVLPAHGRSAARAAVRDPSQLTDEPGHLRDLRCDGGEPSAVAAAVRRFPELRTVVLGAVLTDEVAVALATCRNLIELEAVATDLGGVGVVALAGLPGLRSLTLGGELRADGAAALASLRHLTHLRLALRWPGAPVTLLTAVRQMPALAELQCWLPNSPPAGAWTEALAGLAGLQKLGVVVDGDAHAPLVQTAAKLPLSCLRLGDGVLTTADLQAILAVPTLRCLDLRGVSFAEPATAAAALGAATRLEWLGLAFTNLPDALQGQVLRAAPDRRHETGVFLERPDGRLGPHLVERGRKARR